jgi:hypothetical protein
MGSLPGAAADERWVLVELPSCRFKPWQVLQVIDGQRSVLAFWRPPDKRSLPRNLPRSLLIKGVQRCGPASLTDVA